MFDTSLDIDSENNDTIGEPNVAPGGAGGAMLLDSRGFTKPSRFDGRQEHWAAWMFRVESIASLCGWYNFVDEARKATSIDLVTLGELAMEVAKSLDHFLVQTVDVRALQLIHPVPRGNGLEVWHVLCR